VCVGVSLSQWGGSFAPSRKFFNFSFEITCISASSEAFFVKGCLQDIETIFAGQADKLKRK